VAACRQGACMHHIPLDMQPSCQANRAAHVTCTTAEQHAPLGLTQSLLQEGQATAQQYACKQRCWSVIMRKTQQHHQQHAICCSCPLT
jgi:negative regulator of sigma E activity